MSKNKGSRSTATVDRANKSVAARQSRGNRYRAAIIIDVFNRVTDPGNCQSKEECAIDLLTNLRHFADREGLDFYRLDKTACGHYEAERAGNIHVARKPKKAGRR